MQKQFCLITEPWIKALDMQGSVKEYSLMDVLTKAEGIRCLAGELQNQDFAVLRLMLSILQTVVYRYNESGIKQDIKNPEDALLRWQNIWNAGRFPERTIASYLSEWEDRFYLMHPKYPFYQIPYQIPDKPGTPVSPGRMIGAVGESDNKARIFSTYSTKGKSDISNAELARWVVHFQNYDSKATKNSRVPVAKGQEKPHPRIAWCGQLGAVFAEGDNLFETLMLNLVLLRTDAEEDTCFGPPKPSWEREIPDLIEDNIRKDIDNQAELLSLQGRWLFLNRKENTFSATAVVGENIEAKNAFIEQMTLWRPMYLKSKDGPVMDGFVPGLFDYTRENVSERTNFGHGIWNRFRAMFSHDEDVRLPGIVLWIQKLTSLGLLPEEKDITLRGVDTVYHKQQGSAVMDVRSNAVDIKIQMLSSRGAEWREMLNRIITLTNNTAELFANFYMEANEATGHSYRGDTFNTKSEGAEFFYSAIDTPFRKWLSDVNDHVYMPDDPEMTPEAFQKKWEATMFRTLDRCARDKVRSCQMQAVLITPSKTSQDTFTGLPSAYDKLWFTIRKLTGYELDDVYWNMLPRSDRGDTVRDYVLHKIGTYLRNTEDPDTKKELLQLRRSFGKSMEDVGDIGEVVLSDFPPEYRSEYGYTRAERAVFAALCFYALNVFGNEYTHQTGTSFGHAVRLASFDRDYKKENPDELKRLVRHMNRVLSAHSLNELMMHLKMLSNIIGPNAMTFDYGVFAHNLFTFQIEDFAPATRLSWAADFLRLRKENKEESNRKRGLNRTESA